VSADNRIHLFIVGSRLAVELECLVGVWQMLAVQNVTANHDTRPTLKQHRVVRNKVFKNYLQITMKPANEL